MNPNYYKAGPLALVAAGSFALAACGVHTPSQTESITIMPDLSGFTLDPQTCLYGGPRPCAVLIRERPQLSSAILNVDPAVGQVAWPFEAFGETAGNPVTVICVTEGDDVTYATDATTTNQWYRVAVPSNQLVNPAFEQPTTPTVDGYASLAWFNQTDASSNMPHC